MSSGGGGGGGLWGTLGGGGGGAAKAREAPKYTTYIPAPATPVTFEPLTPLEIIYPVRQPHPPNFPPSPHAPHRLRVALSLLCEAAQCPVTPPSVPCAPTMRCPSLTDSLSHGFHVVVVVSLHETQDVFNDTAPTCKPAPRMESLGPPRQMRWIAPPESEEWPVNCQGHEELCEGEIRPLFVAHRHCGTTCVAGTPPFVTSHPCLCETTRPRDLPPLTRVLNALCPSPNQNSNETKTQCCGSTP